MLSTRATVGRDSRAPLMALSSPREGASISPKMLDRPEPARSLCSQITDSTRGDWRWSMFKSNRTAAACHADRASATELPARMRAVRRLVNGSRGLVCGARTVRQRPRNGLSKTMSRVGRMMRVPRVMTSMPSPQMTPSSTSPLKPVRARGIKEMARLAPARRIPGPIRSMVSRSSSSFDEKSADCSASW